MTDDSAERWRRIPGLTDYEVSDLGRVRSWKTGRPRIMRPFTDKLGYVRLTLGGQRVLVHRAVAAAWHGPCPEDKEVDHINYVRNDNRPENLRYLTKEENLARRYLGPHQMCSEGHLFEGDNLYIRPDGRRACRACINRYMRTRADCGKPCSTGCGRMANYLVQSEAPVCERCYQRGRRQAKRAS